MNSKCMLIACAAATALVGYGVHAEETEGEVKPISVEASVQADSRYISYGFCDDKKPIYTPSGSITLYDHLTLSTEAIFDHRGKYLELHPGADFEWTFEAEEWNLPTSIQLALGYQYEYQAHDEDTQFVSAGFALPDLWLEPSFVYERDIIRDNGTYLSLELGHTFEITEDLTLRPSIAQGFGNRQRVNAYACNDERALDKAALMDTVVQLEGEYAITENLSITGYVAYSDFLFAGSSMRDYARSYNESMHDSYNFTCGLGATLSF